MKFFLRYKNISKSTFFKDVSYTIIGQLIVMVLMLVLNKVVSHYLTPADYTIFSIANKSASVLAFVMVFGLGIALPVYLARLRAQASKKQEAHFFFAGTLLMGCAIILVMTPVLVFKDALAYAIFNDRAHSSLIPPIVFFAISIALSTFVYSYFRGVDKFRTFNISQILFQSTSVIIVILCGASIANQLSLRGIVISLISLLIIGLIGVSYRTVVRSFKLLNKTTRDIIGYCLPRVPGEIVLFSYTVFPLIIVNAKFGSVNAAAIATALVLNAFVSPLFQFIGLALSPYTSKKLASGESDDVGRKIKQLRVLYIGFSIVAVLFVFGFTEFIIKVLFSDQYVQFVGIVRVLILSVVPYSLYLLLRNPLDAISKIPFNTFNLAISFSILMLITFLSPNLYVCATAFPVAYLVLGVLSEVSWAWRFRKSRV
jgi:O-antigen/teichoic acid export membrane protein